MKSLVLVSATVDAALRAAVTQGIRPCPEFLRLEERHGATILDWSRLGRSSGHRSTLQSLRHVRSALPEVRKYDAVLSDGEHVGLPLGLAMATLGTRAAHVCIGHHLLTPTKLRVLRATKPHRRIDRILVHSDNQLDLLREMVPSTGALLRTVPYGVDTRFWSPQAGAEVPRLIVSAGREHRDYASLVAATPVSAQLVIADHSPFSPHANRTAPSAWPEHVARRALGPVGLRELYDEASIVVVPVLETTFPAGITTLLEAMSMGKPVIATGTAALQDVLGPEPPVVLVPPGDTERLADVIEELLDDRDRRAALGEAAWQTARCRFSLDSFVDALDAQLVDAAAQHQGLGSVVAP